jgi:hypothetical protein
MTNFRDPNDFGGRGHASARRTFEEVRDFMENWEM